MLFVFEMANNHMGDLAHGIRIVRELKDACAGFDFRFAVKLQYRDLPGIIHPDFRTRTDLKFVKRFMETRLSWDDLLRLKQAIVENGFLAACSPWDEASVDKVVEHGFDYLKVSSASLTDWPLAERIAQTSLPIILSTAGEDLGNVDRVVNFFRHRGKRMAVLHCVAQYPTPTRGLEMNQLDLLRSRYPDAEIGYSTHEPPGELVPIAIAIAKGATVFEKHVGVETPAYPLNAYSANPAQVRAWLGAAAAALAMTGTKDRYRPSDEEASTLKSLQRGVFAGVALGRGDLISAANVSLALPRAPGQLSANDLSKYREYRALSPIAAGAPVNRGDVEARDTQSAIQSIILDVRDLLRASGTPFPTDGELEISHHYGIDRFRTVGACMVTVVNREYCKRLLVLLPGQAHPEHAHRVKDETFHILHGGIELTLDGSRREYRRNDVVVIPRGARHSFVSATGAVIEELSSTYALNDSEYSDPAIAGNDTRKTYVKDWIH